MTKETVKNEVVKDEVVKEETPTETVKVEAVKSEPVNDKVKELEDKIARLEKLISTPAVSSAPVVKVPVILVTPDPVKYEALKEVIEKYKVQNPVKYEIKKEALEAQLSALKPI